MTQRMTLHPVITKDAGIVDKCIMPGVQTSKHGHERNN